MHQILGIDTSNYTTSVALLNSNDLSYTQKRKLLSVEKGQKGLRQSEALFQHIKQLPDLIEELMLYKTDICAVAYSDRPRNVEGSYMPCFLAGELLAKSIAAALDVPVKPFSHQEGHIMAGILSSDSLFLLRQDFLCFHLSGGTTELLLVKPASGKLNIEIVAKTLDISAGQLIDRCGVALGLDFPSGAELEKIAAEYSGNIQIKLDKGNCNLSGFENKIADMINKKVSKGIIAGYMQKAVLNTIKEMLKTAINNFGPLPVLMVGGVCSNKYIKSEILKEFVARFASADLSGDNAVGTALCYHLLGG